MSSVRLFCLLIIAVVVFTDLEALKCKVNDGPSEEKMKRVARSCMRKLSDDENSSGSDDDYEDSYDNQGGSDRGGNEKGLTNRRNQNQQGQNQRIEWSNNSPSKQSGMDRNGQQHNENHHGNAKDSNSGGRYQQNSGNGREKNKNNNNGGEIRNAQTDKACVIHCFFKELNMLNNQDYPDKHKVIYVITRDLRDNELREFYADSIQECFSFLEMQQRRDKCQFSKDLINCMAEYARANCDDWYNQTMIFNN